MNLTQRLGPFLYATLHSYNSAWELMLGRSVRRDARRDTDRLRALYPSLADYKSTSEQVRRRLSPHYDDYTSNVSPGGIAVSLELATFTTVMCELTRPKAILDLGSGFSSFAFRKFARDSNASEAQVYSIDDSPEWLGLTRGFLERHHLPGGHLLTWDEFAASDRPKFDIALHDIGDLKTRLRLIEPVVTACRPGALIIIDDMHVPSYRQAMLKKLDRLGLSYFSLRPFTRKRMRYSYLVTR